MLRGGAPDVARKSRQARRHRRRAVASRDARRGRRVRGSRYRATAGREAARPRRQGGLALAQPGRRNRHRFERLLALGPMSRTAAEASASTGVAVWSSRAWLDGALRWLDEQLGAAGMERTGEPEQPHLRPWATALCVPTRQGPVWLKA